MVERLDFICWISRWCVNVYKQFCVLWIDNNIVDFLVIKKEVILGQFSTLYWMWNMIKSRMWWCVEWIHNHLEMCAWWTILAMSKRQPFFPGIYPVLLNNLHLMLSVMCFVCIYFATPYDIVSSKKNKPCENENNKRWPLFFR